MKNRKKKILVTYASEHGSTQEIAVFIAKTLSSDELSVDMMSVDSVRGVEQYAQVIIGSPIQYDTWREEAKVFLNRYETELSKKPVAYFFTCLTLVKKSAKTKKQAQGYADKLLALNLNVQPQYIGQFAGVLDYSKFSLAFRFLARIMFTILGVKEGDYREWSSIMKWSNNIKIKG